MITNYLSPIEFEFSVKRLPNVSFFIQRATVPGISIASVQQPTPFNLVYHSPDKMDFQELQITFIVDEEMKNYSEIYNWMIGLAFPRSYSEFSSLRDDENGLYSDISLLVKNSHKNPNIQFTFINAFPTTLSEVQLDTTQTDVIYPEVSVSFRYDSFSLKAVS
jgi:hypothetical protein